VCIFDPSEGQVVSRLSRRAALWLFAVLIGYSTALLMFGR
jgi:hypothetical protein